MEKMNVYVLTKSDTAKGVGEVETKGYATYKEAYAGMVESVRKHINVEFEKLTNLFLLYGKDFDCGKTYATINQGNPCYWEIHSVDIPNPLVPALVEQCFRCEGATEPHREILETLAEEVAKSKYNRERFDNVVDDLAQENLIGESLYQNARAAITQKESDEIEDAIEHYLKSELYTEKDSMWFDKMLAICAGDPKALSKARNRINEMLPVGKKLSDFDVTVKLTLPKSMLEEMLSTGKVSVNYD